MMGRIGFRRLLPILFVLIHAALLLTSAVQHAAPSDVEPDIYAPLSDMPPPPLTVAHKAALVLNLPALFLSIPVVLAFPRSSDAETFFASLPFVPFVWYVVGKWIDRLLGYIPQPRRLRRKWQKFFAIISAILMCLGIAAATPVNHHRTPDTYWVATALTLWSGLFLAISASGLTRHSE
jgi:hypothetical protein